MFKRTIGLISLIFTFIVPTLAQDVDTPTAAINAALSAVEAVVGERSQNFTFELLDETNDSSLGCPLITGEELPFTVTPIRVTVIYPDASYIVYTSRSGQTTFLCDPQFGEDVIGAQLNAEDACVVTPLAATPVYIAPNLTIDGVFTAGVEEYPVYGVSADASWYQIYSDLGMGWVEATSVTVTGNCDNLATTAVTDPIVQVICFVTPQGSFTNVRAGASTDTNQVGRIYENEVYQISSRNTDGNWFYIQPVGWVSDTVVFQQGDCANIPVNNNGVGIGFIDDESGLSVASDVALILEQLECTANFEGYLAPRIAVGESNAQIVAGDVPNAIRAFPSVDDTQAPRLGTIQPQRILDRVLAGPVCNQGFVWWLVEIDGTVGWTAESNQSSNDYYIEPVGGAPVIGTFDELEVSTNPVTELIYNTDATRLFALSTEQGFGDATLGVVIVFDGVTGVSQARIEEPTGILDIDYNADLDDIVVASGNGIVTIYDAQTLALEAELREVYSIPEQVFVEIQPSKLVMLIASCTDETCTASNIRSMDIVGGIELASFTTTSPVLELEISADDSTLAVLTEEGVNFYTPDTLTLISTWKNSDGFALNSVALNENGSSALVAGCNNADCDEGRIGLINATDGALVGIVPSHTASATNVTYSNDGTRFVTVAEETGELIERSATTGEVTQTFEVQLVDVVSLAYTPDGTQIAVGTSDGRVQFLELSQ